MRKFKPIGERKSLEKDVEQSHRDIAKKAGYFVTKIEKTSTDGFPDRFYARHQPQDHCQHCGRGRIVLIEWKREGETPSPIQEVRIKELRAAGVEVYVVESLKDANRILGIKK